MRLAATGVALAVATLVLLVGAGTATAAQRFAAPTPLGSQDCSTAGNACDIETAVNNAPPNDEVILASGSYGSASTPIGNGLATAFGVVVHGSPGAQRPVLFSDASGGAVFAASFDSEVRDLEIRYSGPDVALSVGIGALADRIVASTQTADAVCSVTSGIIRNSVCWNTKPSGASPKPVAAELNNPNDNTTGTLRNVTAIATASDSFGLSARASAADNDVVLNATNVIARGGTDPDGADVRAVTSGATGSATVNLDHSNFTSEFEDPTTGGTVVVTDPGTGTNQPTTDVPAFADQAGGNFHQAPGSPTIDGGIDNVALNGSLDFDGGPRVVGARTDIGADEIAPPATSGGDPAGSSSQANQQQQSAATSTQDAAKPAGAIARQRAFSANATSISFLFSSATGGPTSFGASVSVPGAGKLHRFKTVRRTIRPGVRTRIRLRIPRKARRAMRRAFRRGRRKAFTVKVTARGAGGAAGRGVLARARIRIVRPRR